IGAGVEQIVLYLAQHSRDPLIRFAQRHSGPNGSVRFVTVGVRHQARIVFANPREVAQTSGAVVAGSGVYAAEMNCHGQTVPARLTLVTVLSTLTRVSERFVVTGGNRLAGEVAVTGAKNSVLKLMAAALLAEGTSTITNCPDI